MNARSLPLHRSLAAAAATLLMTLGVGAQAQSGNPAQGALQPNETLLRPGLLYAGGGLGLHEQTRFECGKAPVCDRPRVASKLFGGVRLTPGLAVEINQFYFASGKATAGPGAPISSRFTSASSQSYELENRATSLGINWEIETFRELTSHVRLGLARVRTKATVVETGNVTREVSEGKNSPYLGLGMSIQLAPHFRFNTGYDFLRGANGTRLHVLWTGVTIEN